MLDYPQETQESVVESLTTDLIITHAPYSDLHIESRQRPSSTLVTFSDSTDQAFFLPPTQEIAHKELIESIKGNLDTAISPKGVVNSLNNILPLYKEGLYGEYLPHTKEKELTILTNLENTNLTAKSLNPALFLTYYLLENKKKDNQEFVFHPDLIYFLAQGKKENVQTALTFIDSLSNALGVKSFIENISLNNPAHMKVFKSFIEPSYIYNLVREYKNIGIVFDLEHLEKHFNPEYVINNAQSIINNSSPEKIIFHSRKTYKEKYNSVYTHAIKKGIPWVIEK